MRASLATCDADAEQCRRHGKFHRCPGGKHTGRPHTRAGSHICVHVPHRGHLSGTRGPARLAPGTHRPVAPAPSPSREPSSCFSSSIPGWGPVPYSHAQSQCHTGAGCTLPSRTSASPSPHTSPPPALSPPPTQPPTLFPPSLPSQGGLLPPQTRCPDAADAFFSCPHQDPRGCLWLLVTFLQGDEAPSHTATEKQQGDPSQVRPGLATQRCQPDGKVFGANLMEGVCLSDCGLQAGARHLHPVPVQTGAQVHGAHAGTLSGPTGLRTVGHRGRSPSPSPPLTPASPPPPPGSSAAAASGAGPLPTCTSYSMCDGTRTATWGW